MPDSDEPMRIWSPPTKPEWRSWRRPVARPRKASCSATISATYTMLCSGCLMHSVCHDPPGTSSTDGRMRTSLGCAPMRDADGVEYCASCLQDRGAQAARDAATAAIERVRALHWRVVRDDGIERDHEDYCAECSCRPTLVRWPCKTVAALDAPAEAHGE